MDLNSKSKEELEEIINQASEALKAKSELKQKEVIAQIRELAASINMKVEIYAVGEPKNPQKSKRPDKYRDPANPDNRWSGRGANPKWLKKYIDEGRVLSEFEIKS